MGSVLLTISVGEVLITSKHFIAVSTEFSSVTELNGSSDSKYSLACGVP